MNNNISQQPDRYQFRIKENLDAHFADWLGDLTILHPNTGGTLLITSFTDQPALRGFIEQLWNLNLTLISVERIENES